MEAKTPKSAASDSGSVFFNQRSFGSDTAPSKPNKRNISKSKLREYRDAFSLFDKDGNGYLTKEELGHVMHQLGQWARMEELQDMLAEIDTDGDGNVSFEEFVEILLNITDSDQDSSAAQEEQELRDAFKVFDKHNRGYITSSDLRAVLQCLGEDLDEDESKNEQNQFEYIVLKQKTLF
jgi:calmodulin